MNHTSVQVFETVAQDLLVPLFAAGGAVLAVGLTALGSGIAISGLSKTILGTNTTEDSEAEATASTPFLPTHTQQISRGPPPSQCAPMIFIIMASMIAINGLIVAVFVASQPARNLSLHRAVFGLGAGLAVGLAGLGSGLAFRDIHVPRHTGPAFTRAFLTAIYAEALGIYGLIIALILVVS